MERRTFLTTAWTLISLTGVLSLVYHLHWMPVSHSGADIALFSRGIGTPLLLWLNGYLGVFFNFQLLSPLGALAVPLILFGMIRWTRLEAWHRALLLFTLLAALVIGVFGGFNYRYAFTLQPIVIVAVVAVVWSNTSGAPRAWMLTGLAALGVGNTALSLEHRQRMWRAEPGYSSPDTKEGSLSERLDSGPRDLEVFLTAHGVRRSDTVLVNNLPIWYYVTDRPGIYFWCGSDQLFLADGKPFLFRGRTEEQVRRYLVDSLHCRFIFSTSEYNKYDPRFISFLANQAELLDEDDRGHTLHKVKDTFSR